MYARAVERVPSVFLLVPGPWTSTGELLEQLGSRGIAAQHRGGLPTAGGDYAELVEDEQWQIVRSTLKSQDPFDWPRPALTKA